MSAYIIATIEVLDRAQYRQYEAGFIASIKDFPGEVLVAEENPQLLEGIWPGTRTVVMRFPDEAVARGWYQSPAYQELIKVRLNAARTNLILAKSLR